MGCGRRRLALRFASEFRADRGMPWPSRSAWSPGRLGLRRWRTCATGQLVL